MVWGETTFDECVATVHEAVAAGINLIDLAPSIDTLVLGVKNRTELAECVDAADAGPLPSELMARVDEAVPRDERT
jgi:aryl-alcohol dehydrogenase-like predicted oxidoreductase